ncbi:hypothetical protein H5185_12185 [Shewanella sp. SG44-6]|jgi:hypothetical protein|uniref:hypothetical protein n=1 Tax=Shewanella sp. SG44-6 TaxID=2760959 RepID=UPI0015FFA36D|nr:hypothetical protein [Shewanella sp. SG44-6]MBB1390172.1 hypothetical protein [Shewanella sp. SG44-6]
MLEANKFLSQFQSIKTNHCLINVINDGPLVKETNFFESELCNSGVIYISWNANEGRLFLSELHKDALKEITSSNVTYVIMRTGTFSFGLNGIELMFEDGSLAPYSITITDLASDRKITTFPNNETRLHIYTADGLQKSFKVIHLPMDSLGY